MPRYINFYFKNLSYCDEFFRGTFSAPDYDIICEFEYSRKTESCRIWNNNKPEEEILPIPIWWLIYKLETNGKLSANESKISY